MPYSQSSSCSLGLTTKRAFSQGCKLITLKQRYELHVNSHLLMNIALLKGATTETIMLDYLSSLLLQNLHGRVMQLRHWQKLYTSATTAALYCSVWDMTGKMLGSGGLQCQ